MTGDGRSGLIEARRYGDVGPHVVLVHGGPGAAGHMAPIARRLAHGARVLEPFQRSSGGAPLTVRRHIEDLRALLDAERIDRAHVVGSSWGAMLALAFAADHPDRARSLVLIGCGTFDGRFRERFKAIVAERLGPDGQARIDALARQEPDPDKRLAKTVALLTRPYSHDLLSEDPENVRVDARANRESWDDMLRLQVDGVYPQAFRRIDAPVLMLHGVKDPHPGPETRDGLLPFLPQLEYVELPECGHFPWLERAAQETFYARLEAWLRGADR